MLARRSSILLVMVHALGAAFLACGDGGAPSTGEGPGGADGGEKGDGAARAITGWETVERLREEGGMIAEKVSYRSQGLRVFGLVCRPAAEGRFKTIVYNHGGFEGTGDFDTAICVDAVRNGYVIVESSYRGEDGSEGRIEVCLGEVDDVLAITDVARSLPYVDPDKVSMLGVSHGGCITTRAVQRGAKVAAAVDVFGPKDLAENYRTWKARRDADAGPELNAVFDALMRVVRDGTGGTPEEKPEEYAKRSPLQYVAELDRFPAPYMAVHGVLDALVLARDTCRLAAEARGLAGFHVNAGLEVVPSEPPGCEGAGGTWLPGPKPSPAWPGDRYAVVYDAAGHELGSPSGIRMHLDALEFLAIKVP